MKKMYLLIAMLILSSASFGDKITKSKKLQPVVAVCCRHCYWRGPVLICTE